MAGKKRKPKARRRVRHTPSVPPPAPPAAVTGPVLPESVEVSCPTCTTHWANVTVQFGEPMHREHFAVREDFVGRVKFTKAGLPYCPACNFEYTPMAMYALIMASANRQKMENKIWSTQRFHQPNSQ